MSRPQVTGIDRRRFLGVAAAATVASGFAGLGLLHGVPAARAQARGVGRALTVYYSRTGHTRSVAEAIHRRVGGDLVRVDTATPYPEDYNATVAQARRERDSGAWPQLATRVESIGAYDIVFLGTPIWGDHLNPPMKRFLSDHAAALSGTALAPFATYIVSRMGQVRRNILDIAPGVRLRDGLAIRGEDADRRDRDVDVWLGRLGLPLRQIER